MPFSGGYRVQAALLIRTLPAVAEEDCFALKGGTATNFFVRGLPRLSVDIDLTFLPEADPRRVPRTFMTTGQSLSSKLALVYPVTNLKFPPS